MDDLDPLTIDGFLARRATTEGTKAAYRDRLATCERLLGKPLKQATQRDLATLMARLREKKAGLGYALTAAMFYRAGDRKDLAALCAMKVKRPKLRPDEILTPKDVQSLAESTNSLRNRALIGALWDTGGRITELLATDLRDVKRQPATDGMPAAFRLFFSLTKTDEPRYAYVTETESFLSAWLKAHPVPDDASPLFCNADGSRMSRKRAWAVIVGARRRAGIRKPVHPHSFRHARATHYLRLGMSEPVVRKLLGWADRSTQLARYGHLVSGDAYRAYLRATGVPVPPPEAVERLLIDEERLVPVVPVIPNPAARTRLVPAEIAAALQDPKVLAFVMTIAAMQKAAPTA
ncbi:MAG TPA: tyrosine-type recombinase/integrase [Thermoplasmata archaeon]|nr:tyrosine-type recombinase/integrase [Thermoplasmata archaeon]